MENRFAKLRRCDEREGPASCRSPPLRGRCPAGQRGVKPHPPHPQYPTARLFSSSVKNPAAPTRAQSYDRSAASPLTWSRSGVSRSPSPSESHPAKDAAVRCTSGSTVSRQKARFASW